MFLTIEPSLQAQQMLFMEKSALEFELSLTPTVRPSGRLMGVLSAD